MDRTIAALTALLLAAGCAHTAPKAQSPQEAEAAVRANYGDAFMEDIKTVKAAEQDGRIDSASRCLKAYAAAVDRDKEHAGKSDAERDRFGVNQQFRACAASCKNGGVGTPVAAKEVAARYEATCHAQAAGLDAAKHIVRFHKIMERVPSTRGALNWMYLVSEAKGALMQAREGKGPESYPDEAKALAAVEEEHKVELEKARRFVARADVIDLAQRRTKLKALIDDLKPTGMNKTVEVYKAELRGVEAKYEFLVREAGL